MIPYACDFLTNTANSFCGYIVDQPKNEIKYSEAAMYGISVFVTALTIGAYWQKIKGTCCRKNLEATGSIADIETGFLDIDLPKKPFKISRLKPRDLVAPIGIITGFAALGFIFSLVDAFVDRKNCAKWSQDLNATCLENLKWEDIEPFISKFNMDRQKFNL